jgi:hypothetical protein
MEVLEMTHRKSFIFKSNSERLFAVVFATDGNGKIMAKSVGFKAFPNNDFVDVFSINATTEWLTNSGHTYVKRLPIPDGKEYAENVVLKMLKTHRSTTFNINNNQEDD